MGLKGINPPEERQRGAALVHGSGSSFMVDAKPQTRSQHP